MKTLVVQLPKRITERFMAHFKALVMNYLIMVITTKKNLRNKDTFLRYGHIYVCVCRGPNSIGGITWAKHAHAQSQY